MKMMGGSETAPQLLEAIYQWRTLWPWNELAMTTSFKGGSVRGKGPTV